MIPMTYAYTNFQHLSKTETLKGIWPCASIRTPFNAVEINLIKSISKFPWRTALSLGQSRLGRFLDNLETIKYSAKKILRSCIFMKRNAKNNHRYTGVLVTWSLQQIWAFWGALSPKIASIFVHLVRISRYRAHVLQFFAKHWNPHQKFQILTPTIFNLKTEFVITSCAFKC